MFTGIVQATSTVREARLVRGSLHVRLKTPRGWKLAPGQSVAVDGICSTVAARAAAHFDVVYMPETLRKTTAPAFRAGRVINLERSLTLKSFIDGHLVQGHVDAVARVSKGVTEGTSKLLSFTLPAAVAAFIAPRGSVCVNGVSLTVTAVRGASFSVALVDYTLKHTNLGALRPGDRVNIEADMLARYAGRLLSRRGR